ncbi:capsular biosynthesis protein [Halobacillus halophilus]|uniref:Capsular polysaccharide biosynthesis protein,putative chain length regulator n=1 Tax=Halobacillus halophilus (strain ATCC 35676 / DSM 2266 / JCM 20832 / KCTC 3685 / LMG 17431 / NBRC 102448 / NCIMB 2269) TaxID=866895 RepID=I0JRK5_HALH3|nr:Wzz/FepE/Etk N-terminal domain-containing protein [Halobacillus halophilus]ASF40749.1 capsular biosynthesis protein [Halobacillus halophilus]CCG46776.1 capsular polysaccharide biosynthesis protein,putative chain length regulator [Halobacillus halophilus DSM 2266]
MEETISLKEIFEVLKKRLLLIIGLAAGAAIISTLVTFFVLTPSYEASSQFIVNQSQSQSQDNIYEGNELQTNIDLINTYNVIIKSPRILDQVVEELGLDMTSATLSDKIQVSNAEQSQVVNVVATDEDPQQAAAIANTTVQVFKEDIPQLMNVDNVNVLSEAAVGSTPTQVSPKPLLNIAIALVVGLMVGVGIAFLLEYLDNTLKSEEDIESHLDLPVMGVVSTISEEDLPERRPTRKKTEDTKVRSESIGA